MTSGLHRGHRACLWLMYLLVGYAAAGCSPQRYGPPSGPAPEYEPQSLPIWDAGVSEPLESILEAREDELKAPVATARLSPAETVNASRRPGAPAGGRDSDDN